MADIDSFFPSKWIKGVHLEGDTPMTIKGVYEETFKGRDGKPDERKLVVEFTKPVFKNGPSRLIPNRTNVNAIAKATGSRETDDWAGKLVSLYPLDTFAFGEERCVVRVRDQAPSPHELADDVPF